MTAILRAFHGILRLAIFGFLVFRGLLALLEVFFALILRPNGFIVLVLFRFVFRPRIFASTVRVNAGSP